MTSSHLPGAPPPSAELAEHLQAALAAKGLSYVPRTAHVINGKPAYTNRLIMQLSPYLLQHAHNPVNWYPWGDEAFAAARTAGKPVFLSIGYSTCHWCHVMEVESFEDIEIATYLNQNYICIKVDREERPDIDAVYMSAVQKLTGSGGWPMSVWLTAEREPFFGGTYFPPRDGSRGVRRGFLSVVRGIHDTFVKDPAHVKKAADALVQAVKQDMEGGAPAGDAGVPDASAIKSTVDYLAGAFDRVHGGMRRAPKFPSSLPIRLLLRVHRRTGDAHTLNMATLTLEKMASGGIYDQIGGGFHRYSTDALWLVPHFEKMLYDNALLVVAYVEAFAATGNPLFARVAREVLDYVSREMTSPDGGFYSATDADSLDAAGKMEEGAFFVWTPAEVERVLGKEAAAFSAYYDISPKGNFEGANILHVTKPDEETFKALASARRKLYEQRRTRKPPLRDDKILAAWNGLMISAFAVAGRVLGEPLYVRAAERAATFLHDHVRTHDRMLRSYGVSSASSPAACAQGFLEDQTFVTAGLLDLFEATSDPKWLREALALAHATQRNFADDERGGWYATAHDGERLLARERPAYDGAEPSGTAVGLMNALRLHTFTEDDAWRLIASRGFGALGPALKSNGLALTETLIALERYWDSPREIVVVWPPGEERAAEALRRAAAQAYVPNHALVFVQAGADLAALAKLVPFVAGKTCANGRPTAYVCEQGRCELPTSDANTLREQLARAKPL